MIRRSGVAIFVLLALLCIDGEQVFATERMFVTEDPLTLGRGFFEFEFGAFFCSFDGSSDSRFVPDERTHLPVIGISWGAGEIVEVQVEWDVIRDLQAGSSNYSHGDLRLFTKLHLFGDNNTRSQAGFRFGVKLPNAGDERGFGTDESDIFLSLLGGANCGIVRLHAEAGLGILGSPFLESSQDDVVLYGAGATLPLNGELHLLGELQGQWAEKASLQMTNIRSGLVWFRGNHKVDLFASTGTGDAAAIWSVGLGYTFRLKTNFP